MEKAVAMDAAAFKVFESAANKVFGNVERLFSW